MCDVDEDLIEVVRDCVRRISLYHASRMSHKGMGFEHAVCQTREFRDAYYGVDTSEETQKIETALEQATSDSIASGSFGDLEEATTELLEAWEGHEETDTSTPDCTLGSIWSHAVSTCLVAQWQKTLSALCAADKLDSGTVRFVLQADKAGKFAAVVPAGSALARAVAASRSVCASLHAFVEFVRGMADDGERNMAIRNAVLVPPAGSAAVAAVGGAAAATSAPLLSRVYKRLSTELFFEADRRESQAVRPFVEMVLEAAGPRDGAGALAAQLTKWNTPCLLLRELYLEIAAHAPELVLERARQVCHGAVDGLVEEVGALWCSIDFDDRKEVQESKAEIAAFLRLLDECEVEKHPPPGEYYEDWEWEEREKVVEPAKDLAYKYTPHRDMDLCKEDDGDDFDEFAEPAWRYEMRYHPEARSERGKDFLENTLDNDFEPRWQHIAVPLKGWFSVAAAALKAIPIPIPVPDEGGEDDDERMSKSQQKKKTNKKSTNKKRSRKAKQAATPDRGDATHSIMRFTKQWRAAVLAALRKPWRTGAPNSIPMLGVCAAFAEVGVENPKEWSEMALLMDALRKGDEALAKRLFNTQ